MIPKLHLRNTSLPPPKTFMYSHDRVSIFFGGIGAPYQAVQWDFCFPSASGHTWICLGSFRSIHEAIKTVLLRLDICQESEVGTVVTTHLNKYVIESCSIYIITMNYHIQFKFFRWYTQYAGMKQASHVPFATYWCLHRSTFRTT